MAILSSAATVTPFTDIPKEAALPRRLNFGKQTAPSGAIAPEGATISVQPDPKAAEDCFRLSTP